jgi:hypothetical protein
MSQTLQCTVTCFASVKLFLFFLILNEKSYFYDKKDFDLQTMSLIVGSIPASSRI